MICKLYTESKLHLIARQYGSVNNKFSVTSTLNHAFLSVIVRSVSARRDALHVVQPCDCVAITYQDQNNNGFRMTSTFSYQFPKRSLPICFGLLFIEFSGQSFVSKRIFNHVVSNKVTVNVRQVLKISS